MTVARYALGLAALAAVLGALTFAAVVLRRRFAADLTGAAAVLADAVLALFLLIVLGELLGTVGLFRLAPLVVGGLAVGGIAAAFAAGVRGGPRRSRLKVSCATAVALAGATAVVAEWLAPTLTSYDIGIRTFDSLWYHLPWAASFAQSGNVASLRFTDVEYLTAFYPATGELLHGAGIVLLGRDTLSPALNVVFAGGALLAAWCVGRVRGIGAATLLGACVALALPMVRFSQAGSAANDIIGIFFLLASVALLLAAGEGATGEGASGEGSTGTLALAALSAGLAASVKLSLLAPALALAAGAILTAARGPRRAAGVWIPALLAAGGYWYVRNLVLVGNPLPWLHLGVLPVPAAPLQEHTGFAVLHYVLSGAGWNRWFEPGLRSGLGPLWPVILVAAVCGPLRLVVRGGDGVTRMLGAVALVALAAYLVTPEGAAGPAGSPSGFAFNLRYAAPALTLALTVTPLALTGARERLAWIVGLSVVLVVTLAERRLWPAGYGPAATLVAVGAGAVGVGLAFGLRRGAWWRRRPVAVAGVMLIAGAGAAAAAAGYAGQRHYLAGRYRVVPNVSSLSRVWQWFRDVHGARVALSGTFGGFFAYPLLGLDLSNRVQYVGARGPHGSFTPVTSCTAWRRALAAGRYRYVVTTPARDPWHPTVLTRSPETAWTATIPGARLVYTQRAHGLPIDVFELTGAPDATRCH